ncbi:hypothetical protein BDF22DRAFT_696129 [Syncephalis plumigaleata]|nr:hypothetical protein BDF22DRAFT_696129 [Syncephalis plumigaleata]
MTTIKTAMLAATAVMLTLASTMSNVVEAMPSDKVGPASVPGLRFTPDLGIVTLERPFDRVQGFISCSNDADNNKQIDVHTSTNNAYKIFYDKCTDYKPETDRERILLDSIGCPLAKYRDENNKWCYVKKVVKPESVLADPDDHMFTYMKQDRDKFVENLIAAHRLAYKLRWFLSWRIEDVYTGEDGLPYIKPGYIMDADFRLSMPNQPAIYDRFMKIRDHQHMMYQFITKFYASYLFPGENAVNKSMELIHRLPKTPVLTAKYSISSNTAATAA